jgi:hypothetical protein
MSIVTFFKSAEDGAEKVATFVVKEMTAAENLLGANTGSVKENIVITGVESALTSMGVPIGTASAELKAVTGALTALFNKLELFSSGKTPPAA